MGPPPDLVTAIRAVFSARLCERKVALQLNGLSPRSPSQLASVWKKSLGRVGERATPCGATHSPLVEPDKQISRHPALLKTFCRRLAQAVDGCQSIHKRTSPKRWICS